MLEYTARSSHNHVNVQKGSSLPLRIFWLVLPSLQKHRKVATEEQRQVMKGGVEEEVQITQAMHPLNRITKDIWPQSPLEINSGGEARDHRPLLHALSVP
jgi:hypothetical protein